MNEIKVIVGFPISKIDQKTTEQQISKYAKDIFNIRCYSVSAIPWYKMMDFKKFETLKEANKFIKYIKKEFKDYDVRAELEYRLDNDNE